MADYIKFAFTAGELSEDLHGRGDLPGFQFGYREGLNVLVDWRGGLRTRPGTLMCEPLFEEPERANVRLSTFSFNTDPEDNYLLIWKHEKLFFLQNHRYLYNPQPVVAGNALLDNFVEDDIVLVFSNISDTIGEYQFTGQVVDANTVKVPWKDDTYDLSANNHRVVKVYSIPTPYDHQDVHDLRLDQFRDALYITHHKYRPRILKRTLIGQTPVFNLFSIQFLGARTLGGKAAAEQDRTDDFADNVGGLQWTVAVIDESGVEHPINYSDAVLSSDVNIGTKLLNMTWDEAPDAQAYRVYGSSFKADFNEEAGTGGVGAVDSSPTLIGVSDQSVVVDTSFSLTLPAAQAGDAPITYDLSPAVPGLTFNSNSRVWSGTPTAADTYVMTYTAEDADGDSVEVSFNLVVSTGDIVAGSPPNVPTNLLVAGQTVDSLMLSCAAPIGGGTPTIYRWVYSLNSNITR